MSTDAWKWMLEQRNEHELGKICSATGTVIPGFRTGKVPKHLKSMAIKQLLLPKTLNKLRSVPITLTDEWEDKYDFDQMEIEDYKKITDIPPSILLFRLLTHQEDETANELYQAWLDEHGADGLKELENDRVEKVENDNKEKGEKSEDAEEQLTAESEKMTETKQKSIQKKLSQKVERLQTELDRTKKELASFKKGQNEKTAHYIKEIEQLKAENGTLRASKKQIEEEYQKELHQWQIEKERLKEEIVKLKQDKSHLSLQVMHMAETAAASAPVEETIEEEKVVIAIVGNPRNNNIFRNSRDDFQIVERNEIQTFNWASCDKIWFLTYRVDRALAAQLPPEATKKIIYIETFKQLKDEVTKGSI